VHGVNRGHINENLDGRKQEDMSLLWETDCQCTQNKCGSRNCGFSEPDDEYLTR
jgi:hypothetical protein